MRMPAADMFEDTSGQLETAKVTCDDCCRKLARLNSKAAQVSRIAGRAANAFRYLCHNQCCIVLSGHETTRAASTLTQTAGVGKRAHVTCLPDHHYAQCWQG